MHAVRHKQFQGRMEAFRDLQLHIL